MDAPRNIDRGLEYFRHARAGPRKYHRALVGDVDPRRCWSDFLARIADGDQAGLEKVYGASHRKAAMAEGSGTTGGYLVPAELRDELMQDVAEEGLFRRHGATVVPMASATLQLPLPDATTTATAGTAPFFGGLLMKWAAESVTRTETEPKFRQLELRAHELTGYALASNPLLGDGARPLDAFLRRLFARTIAYYEDLAFFQGSGVGQPLGVLNAGSALASVARNTSAHVKYQDLAKMSAKILPGSWARAFWATGPDVLEDLTQVGVTGSGWQINQPLSEGGGKAHFVINGQAGYVTDKLPALGTKGDVMLVDPMLYVIGDRGMTEVDVSREEPTAFLNNQSAWRVVHRVDGRPWLDNVVTLVDGTRTAAAYVTIAT